MDETNIRWNRIRWIFEINSFASIELHRLNLPLKWIISLLHLPWFLVSTHPPFFFAILRSDFFLCVSFFSNGFSSFSILPTIASKQSIFERNLSWELFLCSKTLRFYWNLLNENFHRINCENEKQMNTIFWVTKKATVRRQRKSK